MQLTYSSREFNQKTSEAKDSAEKHPVFIQTRGETTHVLLNIREYRKIKGEKRNILEMLAMPEADEIDFDIPARPKSFSLKPAEFD